MNDSTRILFFLTGGFTAAIAGLLLFTYLDSIQSGYRITITFNEHGEFWPEVGLFVVLVAVGMVGAYTAVRG